MVDPPSNVARMPLAVSILLEPLLGYERSWLKTERLEISDAFTVSENLKNTPIAL